MNKHFTHLHLHTDFSLLDGAITLDNLVNFGKENNFKSLAITDHGNIFGAVKFFQKATKAGIKPVLGIEAYLTEDVRIKNAENRYYHIIILVKNAIGYKNLCKLIGFSYKEGFYFKPRIDYKILEQYSEGLIVTSACLGGHIPQLLIKNQDKLADERVDWFLKTFGAENFYLEIQPEDQEEQKILNSKLFDISKNKGIQLVATGDCHYVDKDDREAHEVMLCIQTHNKITDNNRFTFGECRPYMRTAQEMLETFKGNEDAVWNTGKIADECNFEFQTDKLFFPEFDIPKNYTQETYFQYLCKKGLQNLIDNKVIDTSDKDNEVIYWERLNEEVNLIIKMGYIGYFLIVSDFISWAKDNNIPVGPGRGSAAGSLVAWALKITDIDPIKYNLLFERFLNPERVSMPDIDIDFCIEGRDRVINHVKEKYGHEKVCQIITFGSMLAKGVIKDVARVLGFPFEDSNAITELIPDQLKITLKDALQQEPKLQELIDNNPRISKLFNLALKLEGITRHASKHAAGIVISPEPIDEVLPVYIPPKSNDLVTQYAMTELESIGFLKMDFLGLKNLTLIKNAINLIKTNYNIDLDISTIPLDDPKAFKLISEGNTSGVFQLESKGLKEVLRRLQPAVFEDIIAVNALYRPGPLGSGMVDDFIERKHGRQKITYIFNELEPILKETYGVIVYQEQVMKIASTIGGYSLGEADILRRAMGKKKADVMKEQRALFTTRAIEKKFDKNKAGELFDLMAYFAGYGFNKSHSAAYALIAYQTAYLKANYPGEFMAALISLESKDSEKMAFYAQDAKEMGLDLAGPDINSSEINFSTKNNTIKFGLQGIKNVGQAALESILQEREKEGPYKDILDFCSRIDLRTANKRVIESLICAGALDCLPGTRAQKYNDLSRIIDRALEKKRAKETGQMGLFDLGSLGNSSDNENQEEIFSFSSTENWTEKDKLEKEKEVVGLYVSSQPLDSYKKYIKWLNASSFKKIEQLKDGEFAIACGSIVNNKAILTKKGDKMCFLELEDYSAKGEIVVFPKLYSKIEPWLDKYQVFMVRGIADVSGRGKAKLKAQSCIPMDLIFEHWACKKACFKLPDNFDDNLLKEIKSYLTPGSTSYELYFKEQDKLLKLKPRGKVRLTQEVFEFLDSNKFDIKVEY